MGSAYYEVQDRHYLARTGAVGRGLLLLQPSKRDLSKHSTGAMGVPMTFDEKKELGKRLLALGHTLQIEEVFSSTGKLIEVKLNHYPMSCSICKRASHDPS